jgi:hypothetical protein
MKQLSHAIVITYIEESISDLLYCRCTFQSASNSKDSISITINLEEKNQISLSFADSSAVVCLYAHVVT